MLPTNLDCKLQSPAARPPPPPPHGWLKSATGSSPFDVAVQAARRVVELEWPRIVRLAAQLRRRGELDYDACRRIVTARR
jgi:hypothetical protein